MDDDGFKIVRYRKKFSRNKFPGAKHTERLEGSIEDIQVAMKKAEAQLETTGLSLWVVTSIRSILGNRQVTNIYVIGNGHFDAPWEPGTHQFALIRRMSNEFDAKVIFQEPCISKAEREWLCKQDKIICRDRTDVQFEDCGLHNVVAKRFLPARGTAPLPRYLWDLEDLRKKTGGQYTHEPLRINRLGGRDPNTGRKVNQHIGGGVKFDYFMIDFHRRGPTEPGKTYDERVLEVRRDPNRSSHIAFVAGMNGKRWILATENMKAGDIIKTSCHIPENPVIGVEGNAYPVGALVAGTLINSVERHPSTITGLDSDVFVVKAGTAATIVRHEGDFTVIRLPHKHEFSLHRTCMATVGRLSHAEFDNKIYGSAQMHRRFGYKMASGLFHKKDGYFGRKIRRLPPVRVISDPPKASPPNCTYSLTKDQISGLFGHAKVHNLLPAGYTMREYDYYKG